MKKNSFFDYLTQSLLGAGALIVAILFFFALYKIRDIITIIGSFLNILMPLIYGLIITFLLSPLCNKVEGLLEQWIPQSEKKGRQRRTLIRGLSVAFTVLSALIFVILLLVLVLPQFFGSVLNLINNIPTISETITHWIENAISSASPETQEQVLELYENVGSYLQEWVENTLLPQIQSMLGSVSVGLLGLLNLLKNLILGLVVSVYLMISRKKFLAQSRKLLYSIFSAKWGNHILWLCREASDTFQDFLLGKIVDSLIIGVICYIGMCIMRLPYAVLISTVIGITNIIPYFGPLIGMIPTTLLLLTVSPAQALTFLIFVLILQQVDGNIIGPRILGTATGLSSFWVLSSLIIFGGMFGFVGMVIGVPIFAVIYDLVQMGVKYLLELHQLPQDSHVYENMDYVDLETRTVLQKVKKEKRTDRRTEENTGEKKEKPESENHRQE
ncbi:MAG: AI-2E family transporter [Lachnospiraceae bacterium]|nr:AI-2E family transporter [Lachnospiraceae bacterium]